MIGPRMDELYIYFRTRTFGFVAWQQQCLINARNILRLTSMKYILSTCYAGSIGYLVRYPRTSESSYRDPEVLTVVYCKHPRAPGLIKIPPFRYNITMQPTRVNSACLRCRQKKLKVRSPSVWLRLWLMIDSATITGLANYAAKLILNAKRPPTSDDGQYLNERTILTLEGYSIWSFIL